MIVGAKGQVLRFVLYESKAWFSKQKWRWSLTGGNNEIICQGEGYSSKQAAMDSIRIVKNSSMVPVIDEDGMHLNKYGDPSPPIPVKNRKEEDQVS